MTAAIVDYVQNWEFSEDHFMCQRWIPFACAATYLPTMLALSAWSRSRPSTVPTRTFSIVYNVFQVFLSGATFLSAALSIASRFAVAPVNILCEESPQIMRGALGLTCYVYYLTKYLEIVDTVLLSVRQKQLTWLHLYHHAVMFVTPWLWMRANVIINIWLVMINSLIHFFMYYYYLQCDLGRRVWWKKYMTTAQIVQLFSGFALIGTWFYLRPVYHCQGGLQEVVFICLANIVLVSFFLNFYNKSYVQPLKGDKSVKDD